MSYLQDQNPSICTSWENARDAQNRDVNGYDASFAALLERCGSISSWSATRWATSRKGRRRPSR